MRDNEVFGVLEEVYYRKQYMEKGEGFRKYKEASRWVWRKIRYRSKKTREIKKSMKDEVESKCGRV